MQRPWTAVAVAAAVTVVGVLPMFLTGALAVQLRTDLDFDQAALGVAFAAFLGVGSLVSTPGGRLADRFGATVTMRSAALVAMGASLLIALLADRWAVLIVGLVLSGAAHGVGQPASNLFLTRYVPLGRQGLAFGVKQSAPPTAALLGGLAVPALALTVGWRWAFAGTAVVALAAALSVPSGRGQARPVRPLPGSTGPLRLGPLLVLAAGGAFGFAAASGLTGFLVDASVLAGLGEASAGLLLSFGSVLAVGARLMVGFGADRREGRHLLVVAAMLGLGTVGFALLAAATPVPMIVGTMIAFATTWGWSGLYFYAIVRVNPAAPGAAGGIAQTGAFFGGVAGPILFGWVAAGWSYQPAWLLAGLWSLLAGVCVWGGRRWDVRRRMALPPPPQFP